MEVLIRVVLVTLLGMLPLQAGITRGSQDLVIIDTVDRDASLYQPTIDMFKAIGYSVAYKPLDMVIDHKLPRLGLPRYKAALFILGHEFMGAIDRSHICVKVLQALNLFARQPGVLVCLAFPSLKVPPGQNLVACCAPIFNQLGVVAPQGPLAYPFTNGPTKAPAVNIFSYVANIFLSASLESRPMAYHTTLNMPRPGMEFDIDQMQRLLALREEPLCLLPLRMACSPTIKKTLPYGLLWRNEARKNSVLLLPYTLVSGMGSITESFHVTPMDSTLRIEMMSMIHRTLWEAHQLAGAKNGQHIGALATKLMQQDAPPPPRSVVQVGLAPAQRQLDAGRKVGWMDIDVFAPAEPGKAPADGLDPNKQQDDLVNHIVKAGFDLLWTTANPHMYLSSIGKHKDKQARYRATLSCLTKKLAAACRALGQQLPKLYIGFEITNNLYAPNLPKNHPIDLYEHAYADIPVPIDMSFWRSEVTEPLHKLVAWWQDPQVSNGVKLGGVVLDLEMYCRKQTGSFTTAMGFEALSFNKFAKSRGPGWQNVALRDRPLMLMQQGLMQTYYKFLEEEAKNVGLALQREFNRAIPGGGIMCYLPHIQISWPYKGLMKGLTAHQKSLQLLTFNSEFYAHERWFQEQQLLPMVTHSSVIMFSKLREPNDFSMMSDMLARHGSIWLNRISRWVEKSRWLKDQRDWTCIEAPGFKPELDQDFCTHLRQL